MPQLFKETHPKNKTHQDICWCNMLNIFLVPAQGHTHLLCETLLHVIIRANMGTNFNGQQLRIFPKRNEVT